MEEIVLAFSIFAINLSGERLSLHTIPLFRLLPGLPSRIFSSLTAFLGGIFRLAYPRFAVGWLSASAAFLQSAGCEQDSSADPAAKIEIRRGEVKGLVRGIESTVVRGVESQSRAFPGARDR